MQYHLELHEIGPQMDHFEKMALPVLSEVAHVPHRVAGLMSGSKRPATCSSTCLRTRETSGTRWARFGL